MTEANRTEDLVTALRDARRTLEEMDATGFDGPLAASLYLRAAGEIERLRAALAPFVNAHREAMTFMSRCGDNHNAMEARDLYMWWAPRNLSVSHFTGAVIAFGEKT